MKKMWKTLALIAGMCAMLMPSSMLGEGVESRIAALNALCKTLETGHYNLFELVDAGAWVAKKEETAGKAQALGDTDFSYALMELVGSLHDAHTQVGFRPEEQMHMRILPVQVYGFDDGLRLLAAPDMYEALLGQKVVALNSIPIDEVYERFSVLLSYDNEAYRRKMFSQCFANVDAMHYLGLAAEGERISLTLEDENGAQAQIDLEPLAASQTQAISYGMVQRSATPIAEQARQIYQTAELSPDALLISYYSCQEDPNLPMAEFAAQVKEQIAGKNYARVIVDLRYNGGGDSRVLEPLIDMLDAEKTQKGFALYTLIGENTFSSALMNAVQLKRIGATLVGRPSGGSVNHYGELQSAELEGLPLVVYYSTQRFVMDASYGDGSLLPDITVPFLFEDYMSGRDADVEAALS